MIAEINWTEVKELLPIITAILVVVFDWGILYAKIKTFATREEVDKLLNEKLKTHCPNTLPLRTLDLKVAALEDWKAKHTEWSGEENGKNHLQLQEIRINLKNICEKLGVEYLNGTKY